MTAPTKTKTGAPLEVSALHAAYGPVQVLHGIEFRVDEGEAVVILGANGSGKTTTLRAICRMVSTSGSVSVYGTSLAGKKTEAVTKLGVAHVPQGRGTFADLSVDDNMRLGAFVRRDKDVQKDIDGWYEVFPILGSRRAQPAGQLSGGEQQMLAISRALMGNPRVLLLDEPSLGLAPLIVKDLFERLKQVKLDRGTTMLVVEQNANLALAMADRGYVLEAGLIAISGTAEDLRTNEAVRRAYLGY
ncbi:MAG: putative branched-chain amino acid transporter ATP-binding protein [Frankiales bacterium]|jgi:branched-chain amino acid transport system ATP-binding protein|nr:putative branched-chain amino acid transporter ATP-binding protein [Frankiales bacterium]